MVEKLAPHDTQETFEFLTHEIVTKDTQWLRRCLSVQRQARGLPGVFPTAISAAMATPKSERVYDVSKWRKGMVGFSHDPNIPGTAGHIFYIAGRTKSDIIRTITNDARAPLGSMSYVPLDFYEHEWNHQIDFAATWLNGYDFADFNKPPKPVWGHAEYGPHYKEAINQLREIRRKKRIKFGQDHPVVTSLSRDIQYMMKKAEQWD